MSAASPCARSCAQPAARAANARRGAGIDPDIALLFRAKVGLKNQIPGNKNPFMSNVLGPQYNLQADGSYQSNVLNMLTNSGFVGAVSGTPGTAPTGWTSVDATGGSLLLVDSELTFSAVAAKRNIGLTISLNASTVYRYSLSINIVDAPTKVENYARALSLPSGASVSWELDGVAATAATVPSLGKHVLTLIVSVSSTTGTGQFRLGIGTDMAATGTVTISNPQLTEGATARPYVKSPVSGPALGDVVDVTGGRKMLRTCGAVTNLFTGDTSIARSVSLTAKVYTLQVFGAGSVTCSYGTATVGNPLTFTATAGSTTFTPTGATLWMLTASAYPLPYTPPGTTMPASHATTTNGPWFSLPQYDDVAQTKINRVWAALTGSPMTLAWRGVMGVGSADIVGVPTNYTIATWRNNLGDFCIRQDTPEANVQIVRATDGTGYPNARDTWARNETHLKFLQVESPGLRFRVGYYRVGISSSITWGGWVDFDGSFGPSTPYKLLLGFTTIPMWHDTIALWNKQIDDATLLKEMLK